MVLSYFYSCLFPGASVRTSNTRLIKKLVFFFPIILLPIFVAVKIKSPEIYESITQEDFFIEYMQAFFYFLSSVGSFFISTRFLKNRLPLYGILYVILGTGLLLVSFEEISWGQRIFNIHGPEYFFSRNTQNEISVHNLETIQPFVHKAYILVGLYGTCAWFIFILLGKIQRGFEILRFIVPDWFLSSYFFFVFCLYTVYENINYILYLIGPRGIGIFEMNELRRIAPHFLWRDQEPAELLLSLGFLLFVIVNGIRSRNISPIASSRA